MAKDLRNKIINKETVSKGLRALSLSYYGMQIAHIGVAVMLIGVGLTSYFSIERSVLLAPGATVTLGSYAFRFDGSEPIRGPNYVADQATFSISKDDSSLGELYPERRIYLATGTPSTEMAIDAGFLRDLFITLGEEKEDGAWTMTVYVKPFVRWIWLGAIFMAAGGTLAAADKRYRRLRQRKFAKDIAAKEKLDSGNLQPASS